MQRLSSAGTVYGSAVIPLPNRNALLVVDFAPEVYQLRSAIRVMDKPYSNTVPRRPEPEVARLIERLTARIDALTRALAEDKKNAKTSGTPNK